MLTIKISPFKEQDIWDEKKQEFHHVDEFKGCILNLEHSLISISKWESIWHVPFIGNSKKTEEQTMSYIKCMTIDKGIPDNAYDYLTVKNIQDISDYINDPMSASVVRDQSNGVNHERVTSELIYYWMIALQIPSEFEKWHLNRLMKLIEICNVKNTPAKKMGKNEIIARNQALNAARRAKYNSKG